MKIKPSAGFEHYQNYMQAVKSSEQTPGQAQSGAKLSASATQAPANTDKVTISGEAAEKARRCLLVKECAVQVESTAGAERIARLTIEVQEGRYQVSTADLADAILGKNK